MLETRVNRKTLEAVTTSVTEDDESNDALQQFTNLLFEGLKAMNDFEDKTLFQLREELNEILFDIENAERIAIKEDDDKDFIDWLYKRRAQLRAAIELKEKTLCVS